MIMNANIITNKINEIAKSFNIEIEKISIDFTPSYSYGEDMTNDTYNANITIKDPENQDVSNIMDFMMEVMTQCSKDEEYDTFVQFTNYEYDDYEYDED